MRKLISEEVEFTIKIDNRDFSFWQYREESYKAAYEKLGFGYYNDNIKTSVSPVETLVRNRVKKTFDNEEAFVVVTSYSEREGSFLVTFSLFVFAAFTNYGSFRESLDYLKEDFNYFFRNSFPVETNINISYSSRPNRVATELQRNLSANAISPIRSQLNVLKSLIGLMGFLFIGFALYYVFKVENINNCIPTETIQNAVRIEVDRLNTQRTNEELQRLLQEIKKDKTKGPK